MFQHPTGIEPTLPDLLLRTVFRNLQPLCCMQDCHYLIPHEYQGQARNTRILERKPLIDTSYRIRHRLELKYFHFKFTQILLIAYRAAH